LKSNNAFTLVEVIIALLIISFAMLTLSGGVGVATHASRKSKLTALAVMAAKNLMTDVDIMIETRGYKYVVGLDKKIEKDMEEERYKGWKYIREIKEVQFPISAIIKTMSKNLSGAGEQQDQAANPMEEQYLSLMANNVEKLMKEAVREISITVLWPVKGGRGTEHYTIVYYVVDYDAVNKFMPTL
jgi:prepilin-type N-terminal cleavage/methylation domain-containing protein